MFTDPTSCDDYEAWEDAADGGIDCWMLRRKVVNEPSTKAVKIMKQHYSKVVFSDCSLFVYTNDT